MRKPNYNMERKDRERAKQAKAASKAEKRAAKGAEDRAQGEAAKQDDVQPGNAEGARSES